MHNEEVVKMNVQLRILSNGQLVQCGQVVQSWINLNICTIITRCVRLDRLCRLVRLIKRASCWRALCRLDRLCRLFKRAIRRAEKLLLLIMCNLCSVINELLFGKIHLKTITKFTTTLYIIQNISYTMIVVHPINTVEKFLFAIFVSI